MKNSFYLMVTLSGVSVLLLGCTSMQTVKSPHLGQRVEEIERQGGVNPEVPYTGDTEYIRNAQEFVNPESRDHHYYHPRRY